MGRLSIVIGNHTFDSTITETSLLYISVTVRESYIEIMNYGNWQENMQISKFTKLVHTT